MSKLKKPLSSALSMMVKDGNINTSDINCPRIDFYRFYRVKGIVLFDFLRQTGVGVAITNLIIPGGHNS